MDNKTLGWLLIVSIAVATGSGVFEIEVGDNFYMFVGFAIIISGIWAGIRLIKLDK